ncbi:MAG TPA: phenylacetate--CoA ligase family protein [Pirellulales bacterium]|nr:phenylacetate--CoA ligase family protein [Pirellulales bacterium]
MMRTTPAERRRLETLEPRALEQHQLARLNALLDRILPANEYYATQLNEVQRPLRSLEDLAALPFTFKEGLMGSRHPGDVTANLTYPPAQYIRWHQTSGTRGRPLVVLDTADDWEWWLDCWQYVFDAAEANERDCVLMAFSFGPFIGFWSAYDAAARRGCLVVPGGGMKSLARLELLRASRASVVCCTPSYALHLAEVGARRQIDVGELGVRVLILAGEPGGSIAATRETIQRAWRARALDHAGATEVGAWGHGDTAGRGLHVIESEFIAEFLSVATGGPAGEGELAELVLTNLGRAGCPVIRYRTGDLVRPVWQHEEVNRFVLLDGGVLGRSDDMLIVRGVNVFPSAVEQIVRSFPEILEYRMIAHKVEAMDQLRLEIEDRLEQPGRVAEELHLRLGLKIEVIGMPPGTLPRFEGKGKRFVDER